MATIKKKLRKPTPARNAKSTKSNKRARAGGKQPSGQSVAIEKREAAYLASNGKGFERAPGERERDLTLVADLYLKRYFQWEIVATINDLPKRNYQMTVDMVSADIEELHKRWRESALFDFNEFRWQEIDRIGQIEREAQRAWERSIQKRLIETTQTEYDKDTIYDSFEDLGKEPQTKEKKVTLPSRRVSVRVETESGDAAFLRILLMCSDRRVSLLGLSTGFGPAPGESKKRSGGTPPEPEPFYDVNIDMPYVERARRLISIVTMAARRLENKEKPPIEMEATEVK